MPNLYQVFYNIGLKHYSARTKDGILYVQASTHKDLFGNPVTEVWHRVATSIAFRVHVQEKKLHIQRTNSKQKGMGTKMVDAVVSHFPDYVYSVIDQSRRKGDTGPTFWDKMKTKHPKLAVTKPSTITLPKMNLSLALKLSSITHRKTFKIR